MCDYQGHEFGAPYLDSVCIEGFLWDADSGEATTDGWMYDNGGEIPCPECNHEAWLEWFCEDIEERGAVAAHDRMPREAPFQLEGLRFPQDLETLKTRWLKGYDDEMAELAKSPA